MLTSFLLRFTLYDELMALCNILQDQVESENVRSFSYLSQKFFFCNTSVVPCERSVLVLEFRLVSVL